MLRKLVGHVLTSSLPVALALTASAVLAGDTQGPPPVVGSIGNAVQMPVGQVFDTICPLYEALDNQGQLSGPEQLLYFRCRQLVQTANLLLDTGGPIEFALPQIDSIAELAAALQQVGTEEWSIEGATLSQTTSGRALAGRLAAIRRAASIRSAETDLPLDDPAFLIALAAWNDRTARSMANLAEGAEAPGGLLAEPWGLFVNGLVSLGDKDATALEPGFDFTAPGLTLGVDRRLGSAFVIGGAVEYQDFGADFDSSLEVSGGELDSEMLSGSIYLSWYPESFYVDGIVSAGRADYELERRIRFALEDRTATADTDGDRQELALGVGYNAGSGALQFSPFLRYSLLDLEIDGYTETGAAELNLTVADQEIESSLGSLGVRLAWTLGTETVFVPYVRGEWSHEFEDDARIVVARFAVDRFAQTFGVPTEEPDENYFALGGGFSTVGRGGMQAFIDLNAYLGLEDLSAYDATAGLRFSF